MLNPFRRKPKPQDNYTPIIDDSINEVKRRMGLDSAANYSEGIKAFQEAIRRSEQYSGEAFKLEPQEIEVSQADIPIKKASIEDMPKLVDGSLKQLQLKRDRHEDDLRDLKRRYEEDRKAVMAQLKMVNTSIKAWQAAKAVFDADKEPELGLPTPESVVKVPKVTRGRK